MLLHGRKGTRKLMIKAELDWLNVTYEAVFESPSFILPRDNVTFLEAFHERFHSRYQIDPQSMQATGGNFLSDVHARVSLFGGNFMIDLSVDKMSLVFRGLRTDEDLVTFRDCISLSLEALHSSLTDISVATTTVSPTLVLTASGDKKFGSHLSRVVGDSFNLEASEFVSAQSQPGVNLEVENQEEGWRSVIHAYRDREKETSLVLSCHIVHLKGGSIRGIDNVITHARKLIRAFLDRIEVRVQEPTT